MARRVNLPRADDIFRPTAVPDPPDDDTSPKARTRAKPRVVEAVETEELDEAGKPHRAPTEKGHSGRVRHDEKMTVYITSDELLDLEHARLVLRRSLGTPVDRGRLVRAAVAIALADLEANGDDSALAQRLTQA